jgi:hypothetical protein
MTPSSPGPTVPRCIAVILAVGGCAWGTLLLGIFGVFALFPVPFGVGYVVTVGYCIRAVTVPAYDVRQALWIASLLVQGSWLGITLTDGGIKDVLGFWWLFATVASAVAWRTEIREWSVTG